MNPCQIPGAGSDRAKERPVASPVQVVALVEAITPRYRAAVLLADWCGEVLGLRPGDVDLQAATVTVRRNRVALLESRLQADAPNMKRPGAALIAHYLDLDRLSVDERWSRKHADTQHRLCERFAAPVIDAVTCQDIKTDHMQKIVNAGPTAGEGARVHRMISALVSAGLDAGYLANPRRTNVHWHAGDRPLPAARVCGRRIGPVGRRC